MSIANLQRYAIGDGNKLFDVGCTEVIGSPTGTWCKFEKAVEASSNSLQHLQAKIAALESELRMVSGSSVEETEIICGVREKMRQLSAVQ